MRSTWLITGGIALSLTSCTVLFSESETREIDAGFPGIIDARAQMACAISMPLTPNVGLELVSGHAMDLNQDGRDELLLIADAPARSPEVFIHDGSCLMTQPFDYQSLWQPQGEESSTGRFVPQALAFVPRRSTSNKVAVLAEQDSNVFFASFEIDGPTWGHPRYRQLRISRSS